MHNLENLQKSINTNIEAFNLISEIEERFDVDKISLENGTRIWNALRIYLFFYQIVKIKAPQKIAYKNLYNLLLESLMPLRMPSKNVEICGFSLSVSRKLKNGKFYNIFVDPLYEIVGDDFFIFEWEGSLADRSKHNEKNYSINYIPIHISIFTKTFWKIILYRLFRIGDFSIQSENILKNVINYISDSTSIYNDVLKKDLYNFIALISCSKDFFTNFLNKINPSAVIMVCGYKEFHMALSQACKELKIPSIELQHGIICENHAGYFKDQLTKNRDYIPEYLLTYGDAFSDIVKQGRLFDPEKVVTVGFPYIEKVRNSPPLIDKRLKNFLSNFSLNILITSQTTVADELNEFVIRISKELDGDIGIIFKPHPGDWRNYTDLNKYKNIFLASKYDDIYEILKVVDIHSTVYSTSGLESLAFGKPNIFIELGKTDMRNIIDIVDDKSSFVADSPEKFVDKLGYIISNYENISKEALKKSEIFFKPEAKENFKRFFKSIDVFV